jgi:hypothetical protein
MDYDTLRNMLFKYRGTPQELVEAFNLGCRLERGAAKIRSGTERVATRRLSDEEVDELRRQLVKAKEALNECVTDHAAFCITSESVEAAHRRISAINRVALKSIAQFETVECA